MNDLTVLSSFKTVLLNSLHLNYDMSQGACFLILSNGAFICLLYMSIYLNCLFEEIFCYHCRKYNLKPLLSSCESMRINFFSLDLLGNLSSLFHFIFMLYEGSSIYFLFSAPAFFFFFIELIYKLDL